MKQHVEVPMEKNSEYEAEIIGIGYSCEGGGRRLQLFRFWGSARQTGTRQGAEGGKSNAAMRSCLRLWKRVRTA